MRGGAVGVPDGRGGRGARESEGGAGRPGRSMGAHSVQWCGNISPNERCYLTARLAQERFWKYFDGRLAGSPVTRLAVMQRDTTHPHATTLAGGLGWKVEVRFNVRDRRIEADLTLAGTTASSVFNKLRKVYGAPGSGGLGSEVRWEPRKNPRPQYPRPRHPEASVYVRKDSIEPEEPSLFESYYEWLVPRAAMLLKWRESV
jgi:hypothetical protein